MENKVLTFIERHRLIRKNTTILVAVSGGPDSMALLHLLHRIKEAWQLRLIALTVNHQLRGEEAAQDARYVKSFCDTIGIEHEVVSIDVQAWQEAHKAGTQVAARTLRYEVFAEKMASYQANYLAMGHHGDDQAETMVMSLARSTILSSLSGIPYKRSFAKGEIIRPLLCVTKEEIEDYCRKHHIEPRIDPSNFEAIYTRNKIRQSVMPTIKDINPSVHDTVQRLSENIQEDESYLTKQAKTMQQSLLAFDQNREQWHISIAAFNQYARPLQRRCFRLTLDYLYKELPDNLSHIHETLFFQLLEEKASNQVLHFPHQLYIERAYDRILFYFQQVKQVPFHVKIEKIPSRIALPDGGILTVQYVTEKPLPTKYTYTIPVTDHQLPFYIRSRQDGDRMTYKGLKGTKKIKDILMDAKIPRHEREQYYVLADGQETILWLIGLRKNELETQGHNVKYIQFSYTQ